MKISMIASVALLSLLYMAVASSALSSNQQDGPVREQIYYYQQKNAQIQQDGPVRDQYYYQLKNALKQQDGPVREQYYYQRKDAQRQQDGPVREQYYYQLKKALEQQDEQQKEPDMQPEAKLEQDEPSNVNKLLLAVLQSLMENVQSTAPVIPDEDWGFVDVRTSAHMFWWLYGCTDSTKNREQVPLVLWLQGGPGSSSTGFGNFMEIGPLDINLRPRNTTWTQVANILFIDNPVGTGYSYVDDDSAYTTDVAEIAKDLLSLFSAFLKTHSVFQKMPFYIFCESYGGKMTAAFAEVLQEAINAGNVSVVFKGVGLGDSWISAIDYVNMWGPYLFATSLVNEAELARIQNYSKQTEAAFNNGDYARSTELWSQTEDVIEALTDDVDFYNILRHNDDEVTSLQSGRGLPRILQRYNAQSLSQLMNGPIKQKLHIPDQVVWGSQAGKVFEKQRVDFMKDVISTVDKLLSMGVNVTVYNGQLDLICCTQGTVAWMDKLKWTGLPSFKAAKKMPVYPDTDHTKKHTGGFYQAYKNLAFYWILNAGHMVPADNGDTALTMLQRVITG
ncbi:retinoid-inducible serine carboxypeptidase-like isoform X3 [Halichondria panicea]|uniref:retinoid-inducible serine carboxypeptidase-like isoform X3 n=1 Tax=Halichondria panicea TaxID=6063 RepID=UPI00312B609B